MAIDLNRYNELRNRAVAARALAQRAAGAKEQKLKEVTAEFGCKTIEDVERLYKQEEAAARALEKEAEAALKRFEFEYSEELGLD